MYQSIFSKQWMFDRCIEMDFLTQFVLLLVPITVFILVFKFRFNRTKKIISGIVFGLLSLIASFFVFLIISFVGWLVVGCSWGWFWRPVDNAHKFNWLIKEYGSYHQRYPINESELMSISPSLYTEIKKDSRITYSYNKKDNSYIWVVRPSYYFLVVFDSKNGYSFYNANIVAKIMNPEFQIYPAEFPKLK